ncbi:MAG: hypothetical protein AAF632_02455 [Bacteroidota bacterium]
MRIQIISILIVSLLGVKAKTQHLVQSSDFFQRTIADSRALQHQYDQQNIVLPWVDTYEFRTESDELALNGQKYVFRLTPTSPAVRKAHAALFRHYRKKLSLVEDFYLDSRIEEAYEQWVQLYICQRELALYTQLQSVYRDKCTVYRKQLQQEDFNFTQLIEAQRKSTDIKVKIEKLNVALQVLESQNDLSRKQLSFDDIIDVNEIKEVLSSESEYQLADVEYLYQQEQLDKEITLEKAEKRKILDFAQVEYGNRRSSEKPINERISVGLALKLPTYGKRNLKIEEMKIKQQELYLEHQIHHQRVDDKIENLLLQTHSEIEIYQTLERAQIEEDQAYRELKQFILREKEGDLLLLLDIIQNQTKTELDKIKRLNDVYEKYLAFLATSGKMFAKPFKNYLVSPAQKAIADTER